MRNKYTMAFSDSSYCLAALSVSSVWECQRKISSVVISGQLPEPGGTGCRWLLSCLPVSIQSVAFSSKFTQVGTAAPSGGLSGQSCTEGCRAVRSSVRSSDLALGGGDEPGKNTWPASQLPPPEQGGPPTALCATCVHAHKEVIDKIAVYLMVLHCNPLKQKSCSCGSKLKQGKEASLVVRWILPSTLGQTSSHAQISHMHHVKQLLGVSEKDQSLLPLCYPCSPVMLLALGLWEGQGGSARQILLQCAEGTW